MGVEPTATDLATFAEIIEAIERKNRQRLFYDLFPDEDGPQKDGSIIRLPTPTEPLCEGPDCAIRRHTSLAVRLG